MIRSADPARPVDLRSGAPPDAPQGDGRAPVRREPDRWEVALPERNWRITCESYDDARRVADLFAADAAEGVD